MNLKKIIYDRGVGVYLAVVFSALSLLLTVVLVEIIGVTATEQLKSNIGNSLGELAVQTSDKLDRGMFERYREVQLMAQRAELSAPDSTPATKRAILESLQQDYPYYAWIGLTDMDGKVTVAARGLLEGVDVSKRPWHSNALKGIYLADVHEAKLLAKLLPSDAGKEPMRFVDVAFPYGGMDNAAKGVLGVHLSWQWAKEVEQSVMRPIEVRRKAEAMIVAADGKILLGPPAMQGKTISLANYRRDRDHPENFRTETWPDGMEYLVGFSKSKGYATYPGLGWTVLVRQSADDAFLPVKRIQNQVLASGIGLALLFSLLGLIAARRITKPLWSLARSAQRIQNGEAEKIAPNTGSYFEVNALTSSLNLLVANLLYKEAAFKELNQTLEKRVQQRTAELAQALAGVTANEIRVQTIIDTAQDAFIGVDLHGQITDWNRSAISMFGWRSEEAIGRSLTQLVVPQRYWADYETAMRDFHGSGRANFFNRRLERTLINRRGEEIPVEMTIGLAGTHETYFFSIFVEDISERKKIQQMKNEFISTVSHELRTPLTSIRGSLGLLAGGALGACPPQAKKLVDIANANCERLVRMINDILDIEKMESGNMEFDLAPRALRPLVQQAIDATCGYAGQFNVTLMFHDAPAGEPAVIVNADRDRMIQVVVNLLSNAVKFTPSGQAVEVRVATQEGRARLSVIDHGTGIPEEFRPKIFQKFAQADTGNSMHKGGTGLGLSICRSIVEQHGGRIDFITPPGGGTEFFVELPLHSENLVGHDVAGIRKEMA
ncbi:sensor histidine kinase [Noviherbaspirillum sp.]|uniref:sensor histidine kinase n=1 Tax=Noviherbaspirillum sp. TaxID=1926288 RepID=UPI002FE372E4